MDDRVKTGVKGLDELIGGGLLKFSPSSYPEIARSSSILISLLLYTVHIIFEFKFNLEENNQKNEYIIYLIVGVLGYLFYLYGLAAGVR